QYSVLETNREMIDLAVRLTQRHRLRGYDAVQLASALIATELLIAAGRQRPTLVSADRDLIVAALSEGLSTENPLDHG
ncbi:MAG: hypothetical protein ACKVVP_19555, partial [Chloroflexota bacterium]